LVARNAGALARDAHRGAPSSVLLTLPKTPDKPPIGVRAYETMTIGSVDMMSSYDEAPPRSAGALALKARAISITRRPSGSYRN